MTRPAVPTLTEEEARQAGNSVTRLRQLRDYLQAGVQSGSITVGLSTGTQSFTLRRDETESLLGLLKEREETFLTGLNVQLEDPSRIDVV